MGTHGAVRVLIILSMLAAAIALAPVFQPSQGARVMFARGLVLAFLLIGAVWAIASVRPVPAGLVASGRLLAWQGEPHALYVGEGINSSIAVTEEANGWRNFHVSGKVEASTEPQDMRLQRLLGHLTALMVEK